MKDILKQLNTRPKLFEQSTASIWDDPHISKGMLKAHLNENQESATRKLDFVKKLPGSILYYLIIIITTYLILVVAPVFMLNYSISMVIRLLVSIYQNGQSVMLKLPPNKKDLILFTFVVTIPNRTLDSTMI